MLAHKIRNSFRTGLTVIGILILLLLVAIQSVYGATTKVEAETYTARSSNAVGAVPITDAGDPSQVGLSTRPNEWTSYAGIDLSGANSVSLRYSNAYAVASVEIRTNSSTGTLLGTCSLPLTGSWSTFQTLDCSISPASGVQTLVLVYQTNFYAYLNWFSITSSGGPTATALPTNTPLLPTFTATRTNTPLAPTATATRTNTPPPPTNTPVNSPTRTNTPPPPTNTPVNSPTRTNTLPPPTNTSPAPTATSGGAGTCSPVDASISAPFSHNGAGTFCWRSDNLGGYINSWNLVSLTVNGVSATNVWVASASYPAQIGGYWYVSYNSSVAWGHFEAGGTASATNTPGAPTNTPLPTNTQAGPTNTPGPTYTPSRTPTSGPTPTALPTPVGGRKFIGYFAAWGFYNPPYHYVKDLITQGAAQRLTTINYAFANVQNNQCVVGVTATGVGDAYADYQMAVDAAHSVDGVADMAGQNLMGHWNQLRKLKALYPNLKVLISLGGWTWSGGFSDAALPANRQAFVASCVDAFIRGNVPVSGSIGGTGAAQGVFDGIDIDWEYPASPGLSGNVYRPEDTQNFTALLAEFRSQLDAQGVIDGKHYILTIAAPAGEDKYTHIELNSIPQYLDWMNLMTYDFHGAWDTTGPTNFMAPLYGSPNDPSIGVAKKYYADYAVNAYLAAGVPANKLVLGLPYYGRGWTGVTPGPNNNGLYQSASGPAPSTRPNEDGMEFYRTLKANYESTYTKYYDPITQAMWIYNPSTTVWWSYDDPTSLATKLAYLRSKGLGGAMAWELQADTADGELTHVIFDQLNIP